MLHELRVENLLLLERAELRLAPGLNVLTGETGAGKTLLAHALDLLLGGRARKGIVRPGAPEAYVEGVFSLPPELQGSDRLPTGAEEIVLARRVWPDGRTRAYVCGRSATLGDLLAQAGQQLEQAAAVDTTLQPLAERILALRYEADDLAGELRGYLLSLTAEGGEGSAAGRLEEVEDRLAVLARLERKHGGSI